MENNSELKCKHQGLYIYDEMRNAPAATIRYMLSYKQWLSKYSEIFDTSQDGDDMFPNFCQETIAARIKMGTIRDCPEDCSNDIPSIHVLGMVQKQ